MLWLKDDRAYMLEFELWQAKKTNKSNSKNSLQLSRQPSKPCKHCQKTGHFPYQCRQNPKKPKRIKQKGKRTIEYEHWRDTVAKPYLDKTSGHRCVECGTSEGLDVAHKATRGSRADLKMVLSNVQWKCRTCHQKESGIIWS